MWEYNYTDELYHYGVLGMRWHNRKAKLQSYNNNLVKTRRANAVDRVTKLKNNGASSNKINKAQIKADKIKRSKYGQTRGQILAKGLVRSAGANIIGGTAYKVARQAGAKKVADIIGLATSGYNTANMVKTGYKLVTAYDKPTKKSGTRMSYK